MSARQCSPGTGACLRLTVLLVTIVPFCVPSFTWAQDRPNILFILTDDVGWGDLSPFNPESQVDTPTIEQLAAEGMRFTDAHTSAAKCAPSRYSIITGNYQWRGLKSWGQWKYKGGSQVLAGQRTLGDLLQEAGYRTAFFGKSHLGGNFFRKGSNSFATGNAPDTDVDFSRPMQDGPLAKGFDHTFLALLGIQDPPYAFFENDRLLGDADDLIHWPLGDYGDTVIRSAGIGLPDWNTRAVGPTLLQAALDFIDQHQSSNQAHGTDQPFFIYYNTEAVHSPRVPPLEIGGTTVLGSTINDRLDMVREIEAVLAVLLADLSARDLLDDTLVVLTSDNGALVTNYEISRGHQGNGPFSGKKGQIFEGGHRVPLIVRWGDGTAGGSRIEPGSVSDALVGIQDFYRTLASLTGVAVPEDQGRDSFDILPILLGNTSGPVRDHMIHEGDVDVNGAAGYRALAFREGNWKLHLKDNRQPVRLYNLANDPDESNNLIGQSAQASRVSQMFARFTLLRNAGRTAPLPGTVNRPPQVDAGPDQAIVLPEDTVTLQGSVSDDGLPGGTLDAEWSVHSGPGQVSFADESATVTTATFAEAGVYVLRLLASDGALSASDTVTIVVTSGDTEELTLAVTQDTFTRAASANSNHGSQAFMRVNASGDKVSFAAFDVSELNGPVTSAVLRLFVRDLLTAGTVQVREVLGPWVEATVTHTTRPPFGGVLTTQPLGSAAEGSILEIDITALVQDWQASPGTAYGLALTATGGLHVLFDTREGANPPEIEVLTGN